MEESKKKISIEKDRDIIFTKAIKAGKRIYYLDVKRNRKDELYLAITESKKVYSENDTKVTFEKHKIFLYQEDFDKFSYGLSEALDYIRLNQSIPEHLPHHPEGDYDSNGTNAEQSRANQEENAEVSQENAESSSSDEKAGDSTPKPKDDELNITF